MLRLLDKDETIEVGPIGGTTFTVRKLPHGEIRRIEREHTTGGILDEAAYERALWRRVLAGWSGLADKHGKPVAYDADFAAAVAESLPEEIASILMHRARALEVARIDEGKASSASSGSDSEKTETD